jgi:hypothetical protein
MPIYRPTPRPANRGTATMQPYVRPIPKAQIQPAPQAANPPSASLAQGPGDALTVTWTAPPVDSTHDAAVGFNLQSSLAGAGAWTIVPAVTSPYVLSGLAVGSAIDVQLQSVNVAGNGAWSNTTTLTTAMAVPNPPIGVSLAQGPGSDLTVTWISTSGDSTHGVATGFNLQSSPSGAATWTTVTGVTSPYILAGLAPGAATDVQLLGTNAAGNSAWSATSTLTTATGAPNIPSTILLVQGSGSDLTVSWTATPSDSAHGAATGFNLRSSPSGAGTWTTVTNVTSPYDLPGLAASAAIDVQLQSANAAGVSAWSATNTLTTASAGPHTPNVAAITHVGSPPDGTTTKLVVTWTASTVDSSHSAATAYNVRFSPTGSNTWTTVPAVTSPYTITGLTGAAAIDVEVQASNAAASPSAWSATTTGTIWGSTVVPGSWVAAAAQVHGASIAPNGGVQMTATASPTAVTGAAFAWSTGASTVPTAGLIAATSDGQANGWGAYMSAPATAGTFYLWMLAQGAGGATTGALVTSAIVVS